MNPPANPADLSIDVSHLTVRYPTGHKALEEVDFRLQPGTICALVGVNGSGKSTLFKSIMGFIRPTHGSVRIGSMSVQAAQKKNRVAYVPQSEEIDWTFPVSVWDVVLMGRYGKMGFLRIPSQNDKRICSEALERVQMTPFKDRQIGELSGGQRKRVFLARALAQEGEIMLLDEPFTGVDVNTEDAIIALLRDLRQLGHIILVSTHNLGSVPEFCDQVLIIKSRLLAFGPTAEVFTEGNLASAFGGVLRHFHFDSSAKKKGGVLVLSDDERPLIIGKDGLRRTQGDAKKSPSPEK
ncbi:MAG: ATP-binding cassette domain-containing protein [Spirochaetia bacterium]|nr:ATP-binding cassette domain-containing protein [Spirochaetia bacterium]